MSQAAIDHSERYDAAAPKWGDQMRTLGYYDGYLGFLSAPGDRGTPAASVTDVGSGTAAFSEAWVAIHGAPRRLTLLDPSAGMLRRGQAALQRRDVDAELAQGLLGVIKPDPADVVLAAHEIEHCPDPLGALAQMRDLLAPGGHLYLVVSKPHWCKAIIWLQWRHRTFRKDEIASFWPRLVLT